MTDETVVIRVMPHVYTDDIYVLIPPKFWNHPNIAEGIKKAVILTQEKPKDTESDQVSP